MNCDNTHCLVCGYCFLSGSTYVGCWEISSATDALVQEWQTYYRLIIFDPGRNTYSLSGIGQWVHYLQDSLDEFQFPVSNFVVPTDRNLALTGLPPGDGMKSTMRVPPALSLEFPRDSPSGCPVHMQCWSFVERFIGPEAEENLGLLFGVLRDRYRECEYGNLINAYKIAFCPDPFECKAVRRLIERSISRLDRRPRRAKSLLRNCLPTRFPLDIQYLILDLLDRRDISRMQRAIDWPVSKHYWRYRAPKAFVHELQDAPKDDNYVDWEYLCLGVERISEKGSELTCRRRVFELLQGPRDVFHRRLKEERIK